MNLPITQNVIASSSHNVCFVSFLKNKHLNGFENTVLGKYLF